MVRVQLKGGAPAEPDTGDWDAICSTPGPQQVFAALFHELSDFNLPRTSSELSEDETHRVHTIWLGSNVLGVKVTEIESAETTAFDMYCTWETFGLPGVKMIWNYSLDRAGQLGYCAFRHKKLVIEFENDADQERFARIWQRIIGKKPIFEPV